MRPAVRSGALCKHRARAEGASYQEAECNLSADDK